ncbi:apoptosis-associated speck-like protein containing a CARD [Salvelinus fontinalis]|uniref:apoptosis-associated speck-like protein containing a CARD n=1 Tax=Salvelinus fontinalis TaxID=8038 RepID=UPI0024856B08|nr:apoptosis-associated speck-like protein containing a CARD [Salvelinus fontinalis]
MPKTVGDTLIGVLDDLGMTKLKWFRHKLCERKQEPKIRRGNVENLDPIDLADLLTRTFCEDGALDVAIEVLRAIDCHDGAKELTDFKKAYFTAQESWVTSGAANGSAPGPNNMIKDKHFVDYHRTALIDRVSQVAPILDRLLEKGVITTNAYSDVRAEKTRQDRMRELLDVPLKASGSKGKDVFLDILMEQEPYLISELKGE